VELLKHNALRILDQAPPAQSAALAGKPALARL
jgi:hypothetical protein